MARILILVENLSVPFDRRVWQEAKALTEAGHDVHVVCPRGTKRDLEAELELDGVHIHRYPLRPATGGAAGYLREYGAALFHSTRLALKLARRGRFDVVQACNPPDLLFLVGFLLKVLHGSRFVFDHHDLVPELVLSRFGDRPWLYRACLALEGATFGVADHVISTNDSYREIAMSRGRMAPEQVTVVRSAPDLSRFTPLPPDPQLKAGKPYLLCYLGVMGPQDGIDLALEAVAHLVHGLGREDVHTVFLGSGDVFDDSVALANELSLEGRVHFTGRVHDDVVRAYLSTADVCLAPDPLNPLNDLSTMNKIMEYMAMGRPLVSFDLKEARVSAGEAAAYATANDVKEFATLVDELLLDPQRRERMGAIGARRVAETLSWAVSRVQLLAAYDAVLEAPPARSVLIARQNR